MEKQPTSFIGEITLFLRKHILTIVVLIVAGIFAYLFTLNRNYDSEQPLDEALFGNYGDFISGLLSVVSIYLLVKTLKEQRAASNEQRVFTDKQRKSADEQQIASLFFHLLRHLQREVGDLNITTENSQYTNKDFFEELRRELQESFCETGHYKKDVAHALKSYFELYAKHPRLGSYFRILYRICEIIDQSTLDGIEKAKYIKILRAQLTNSELLLLRYNAQTPHGKKFKYYINEYNLLKHLPTFELLEFKYWWGDMKDKPVERLRVSVFCDELRHEMKKLLEGSSISKTLFRGGWKCKIRKESNDAISIKIDRPKKIQEYYPFKGFEIGDQIKLLECILIDIFSYSNFGRKRDRNSLSIESKFDEATRSIYTSVETTDGHPLSHSFLRLSELEKK